MVNLENILPKDRFRIDFERKAGIRDPITLKVYPWHQATVMPIEGFDNYIYPPVKKVEPIAPPVEPTPAPVEPEPTPEPAPVEPAPEPSSEPVVGAEEQERPRSGRPPKSKK